MSNTGPPCYDGCFYYGDSCYRKDCKNTKQEDRLPAWVVQRKKEYYERMERQAKHPPDEDEWNK